MQQEFMTADELARQLKISVAAVRAWTRQGAPFLPLGRLRRYNLEQVLQWLREREERKRNVNGNENLAGLEGGK
jgi:excisionase family DNA binding protein